MKRPSRIWTALLGMAALLAGCDYKNKSARPAPVADVYGPLPGDPGRLAAPDEAVANPDPGVPKVEIDPEILKRREIFLGNIIKLMRTAYNSPGGRNFEIATEHLNTLFESGTNPGDYDLTPASRNFLGRKIFELTNQNPETALKALASPKWTLRDARHIEDCMLYHAVATRVAGEGDDLTKVRRIFDWIIRNIQLVPAESLSGDGRRQAQVRPADALLRGMATESGGWSERGWIFMALSRQIGVDVGLLTLSARRPMGLAQGEAKAPVSWICAAVVDKKPYLFDPRVGMEIAGPGGKGVATVQEAIADPDILGRMELPGESTYGIGPAELAGSPTRIGVIIDSSTGYFTPRMRLLQGQLRGENRTTLYRDPAEEAAAFAEALGDRLGRINLWSLPVQVEERLFTDSDFVYSTLASLRFFDNKLPLLYARTAHLRGELDEAVQKYSTLRFAEKPVMSDGKDTPIPPEAQKGLDIYATLFLAQIQADRGNPAGAEDFYRQSLALTPDPGAGRNFYYMLRWGAMANLGRLREARGDRAGAIAYLSQPESTAQHHGNLIRAHNLIWQDPLADPVPPPPPPRPIPTRRSRRRRVLEVPRPADLRPAASPC